MEGNMKKLLLLAFCILFAVSLIAGCGQEKEGTEGQTGAGEPEEMMDTTRMDAADTMQTDTMPMDTTMMEGEGEEAGH